MSRVDLAPIVASSAFSDDGNVCTTATLACDDANLCTTGEVCATDVSARYAHEL